MISERGERRARERTYAEELDLTPVVYFTRNESAVEVIVANGGLHDPGGDRVRHGQGASRRAANEAKLSAVLGLDRGERIF